MPSTSTGRPPTEYVLVYLLATFLAIPFVYPVVSLVSAPIPPAWTLSLVLLAGLASAVVYHRTDRPVSDLVDFTLLAVALGFFASVVVFGLLAVVGTDADAVLPAPFSEMLLATFAVLILYAVTYRLTLGPGGNVLRGGHHPFLDFAFAYFGMFVVALVPVEVLWTTISPLGVGAQTAGLVAAGLVALPLGFVYGRSGRSLGPLGEFIFAAHVLVPTLGLPLAAGLAATDSAPSTESTVSVALSLLFIGAVYAVAYWLTFGGAWGRFVRGLRGSSET